MGHQLHGGWVVRGENIPKWKHEVWTRTRVNSSTQSKNCPQTLLYFYLLHPIVIGRDLSQQFSSTEVRRWRWFCSSSPMEDHNDANFIPKKEDHHIIRKIFSASFWGEFLNLSLLVCIHVVPIWHCSSPPLKDVLLVRILKKIGTFISPEITRKAQIKIWACFLQGSKEWWI